MKASGDEGNNGETNELAAKKARTKQGNEGDEQQALTHEVMLATMWIERSKRLRSEEGQGPGKEEALAALHAIVPVDMAPPVKIR